MPFIKIALMDLVHWRKYPLRLRMEKIVHNIQLMHSFEVNIRICQSENSDVHRGEAEVNITFEGWLLLMLTEKNAPIVLLYDTGSLFLVLFKMFSYF